MRQFTLRFPQEGYDRLVKLCSREGVGIRALFEAATMIALEDEQDEHHDMQVAIWGIARDLAQSDVYLYAPRVHRLAIKFEDELLAQFQCACRRFGVTQNAALALVVMPWPESGKQIPADYCRDNLRRILERARHLAFTRRGSILTRR